MARQFYFLLGLVNSIILIFIFLLRAKSIEYLQLYGWVYCLLAVPALYLFFDVGSDQNAVQYRVFLGIFLAFLALECILEFILKVPFRDNWKLLTPYLVLYYAMNYGFIVMVWNDSRSQGLIMLALFVVQIISNLVTH